MYLADAHLGYENDRLRHIRLHEQVNELPDPNYATLKFFMGHLDRQVGPPDTRSVLSADGFVGYVEKSRSTR
jgi:hypothetical protein